MSVDTKKGVLLICF